MSTHFCDRCGAPVRWVVSEHGSRFPLEASSDPQGTFMLRVIPGSSRTLAIYLSPQEQAIELAKGTLLFRHHQSVCYPRMVPGRRPPRELREKAHRIIQEARDGTQQ